MEKRMNDDVTEVKLPKPEIDLKFEHIKQFSFIHLKKFYQVLVSLKIKQFALEL